MDEKTDFTFEFNPNRLTLSALLDEYLNEVSPMTESQISYHATYKLVQKYVEGVTFHDVTRAVRYFSPTYMITFENYIGILQIFFRKWEEYYKKAENSIKNILINIVNKNSYVSDEVQEIIDFFQEKFKDENLENSSIVNTIQKFIKDPHSNDINSILNKIIPKVDPKSKILVKSPLQSQKDFKIFIHVIDLFNISKCISFLNIFKKVKPFFGNVPLKIGFSVECKLRDKSKFSRVVLHKNIELFNNDVYNNDNSNNENNNNNINDDNNNNNDNNKNTYDNNNNNLNDNNNNDSKNNSNHNGIKENNKNESNLERIFYRIDDTITLEFQLTDDELKEYTTDSGYEIIMNSPLIMKLYTVIIPNKLKLKPMKFLYGYLKIPLVPVLFAHGHEIRLSGNFIPLETQFKDDHFNLLLESDKIIKQNKNNFIVEEASDQVMLSFSVKADIDPYICVSSPFARNVEKVDVVDLKSLREKGIMGSESRSCQISAKDEITNKHHLLCFYVDANIEFDTDDLFEMLILDARKPGQNYNGVVRSPFTMYNNQFALLDPDSDYKDVLRPPSPFSENPDSFFKILQEHENLYSYNSIFSNPSKLTQLERCIILCGSLIKSGFNAYVCCGAIDMSDTYCVISFHKKKPGVGKYLHFIEGHVYPVSLISYSIKKDESSKLNKNKDLRLNNLFDLEFIGTGEFKIYNSVHVWCLSEVLNDALPSSFHITTIFNNKNVWINRQEQNSILRINLNLNDIKFWFPVLKLTNDDDDQTKNSLLKKDENQERKDIEKRYLSRYVYSKRKVTFYESFDKVKYEFYFKIEFELYVSENSIQIDVDLHNFLIENKKKLFDKYYTNVVMIDLINLNPVEIQKDKKYTKNKNSNGTDDDDISSSISGAPSFSDLKKKSENDTENQQEKPIQSKNKKILTKIPSTPDISPGPSMKKKMQKITSNPSIKKETTIPNVPSIPIIPTLMMRESSNSNFKKDMSSSSTRKTQSSSRTKKESSVSELISLNLDDNENSSMICQEIEKIIDPNINNDEIEKVIDPNINNDEIEKVIDPNINNEENEKTSKFFFFRKIEAPYFMMPDELLEYIIENNGLRYMDSFDIIINFKSLPLNNCKIDIIIAYDSSFFYPNPEDEIVEIEQYQ